MKRGIAFALFSICCVGSIGFFVFYSNRNSQSNYNYVYDGDQWFCSLRKQPVVEKVWSEDHGSYMDIEALRNVSNSSDLTALEDLPTHAMRECYCWFPTRQEYQDAKNNTNGTYQPRSHYCPVEFDFCGIRSRREPGRHPPTCENGVTKRVYMFQVLRTGCFFTFFVFFLLIASYSGRELVKNALSLPLSFCVRPLNKWMCERILEKEPSKANRMILNHFERQNQSTSRGNGGGSGRGLFGYQSQRQQLLQMVRNNEPQQLMLLLPNDPELQIVMLILQHQEEESARHRRRHNPNQPRPQSLLLKTTVYHAPKDCSTPKVSTATNHTAVESDTEDTENPLADLSTRSMTRDVSTRSLNIDQEDTNCSICYLELEEGERVGLLPRCEHFFHVDCLKIWLTKRNVCPLCLDEDIALPQYGPANANANETTAPNDNEENTATNSTNPTPAHSVGTS